jgi:hypothetical protein
MHLSPKEYNLVLQEKGLKLINEVDPSSYQEDCYNCNEYVQTIYSQDYVCIGEKKVRCKRAYYGENSHCRGCAPGRCRFCGKHLDVAGCTCDDCTAHRYDNHWSDYVFYGCHSCIPTHCVNCGLMLPSANKDTVVCECNNHIYITCKRCCQIYPIYPEDIKEPDVY